MLSKMHPDKILKVAIVGYGNIGHYALQAIQAAPDMELVGLVRRPNSSMQLSEYPDLPVTSDIRELGPVDVAILAVPSREVEKYALDILSLGIATVDSYDIHSGIVDLRKTLDAQAIKHSTTAIISSGWDPGTDSMVRMLMQAIVPGGITYTNFGPGMSMGHTVAARAIEGVQDALSMTIPLGTGVHRRMVYITPKPEADKSLIKSLLLKDDYFAHDETHIVFTDNVKELIDHGHGVEMIRKGCSAHTHNQMISFSMRINNPALTAQILVCAARAACRQNNPGAYTLPEIPIIDLLPGKRESWIKKFC